ncbi:hypothetical protein [Streptomyces sp. MJP52]|uniref:hypothetical protein n=1 Tax=Streptomyces sp. MJP52 TaxID=2940555 RepID=UPI00247468A7|nr:hypothetical protein [Streptomyces sp. MJP52]MDH6224305.1 hypothetical protein [Streptomyces sp. MJP52]
MPQISFPLDKAHQALDEFLNDTDAVDSHGNRYSRHIYDAQENGVAVILSNKEYRTLLDGYHAWQDSQEPKDDPDLPPGYRPYIHSPEASDNRLLPHEPLHKPLAHAMYGKPFEELDDTEQIRVTGVAITCLLRTTLDADTQGVVPVLTWGRSSDSPEPRTYWQLAYKTDVDGLFLRASEGIVGSEWSIVTGSGWRLANGWWSRDDAARAAAAIARVLPYIDWMSADADQFTEKSIEALRATIRRYHFAGIREDQAEPEPVAVD